MRQIDMQRILLDITTFTEPERGGLSFFESRRDIPFEIKRVYYIYNVPSGAKRGFHAHKATKQLLFCIQGEVNVLLNNGEEKQYALLDKPMKGLIIEDGIWHTMEFIQENSILCVAASDYYNEDDYIRDYSIFQNFVRDGYWK